MQCVWQSAYSRASVEKLRVTELYVLQLLIQKKMPEAWRDFFVTVYYAFLMTLLSHFFHHQPPPNAHVSCTLNN
jgi:hypothetical protein